MPAEEVIIRGMIRRNCERSPEGFTHQANDLISDLGKRIKSMANQLGEMELYEIRFTAELVKLAPASSSGKTPA